MSRPNHPKCLLILSEDDAYRDLANGFAEYFAIARRRISVPPPAKGGGRKLLKLLQEKVEAVRKNLYSHVLLLFDLDGKPEHNLGKILSQIPDDIKDRVYVLCALDEAEYIKSDLRLSKFEAIGEQLAASCDQGTYNHPSAPWQCSQLKHNKAELGRLAGAVRPFIFLPALGPQP